MQDFTVVLCTCFCHTVRFQRGAPWPISNSCVATSRTSEKRPSTTCVISKRPFLTTSVPPKPALGCNAGGNVDATLPTLTIAITSQLSKWDLTQVLPDFQHKRKSKVSGGGGWRRSSAFLLFCLFIFFLVSSCDASSSSSSITQVLHCNVQAYYLICT